MKKIASILVIVILAINSFAQDNTISVKKKVEKANDKIEGLYYSSVIVQEYKTGSGLVSYKQVRQYIYFINSKDVFIFYSSQSPQKVSKKLEKKGIKLADEYGNYTRSENDIYFAVQTIGSNYSKTYRYVGTTIEGKIYLNYKAAYKEKMALDIYLYKYETSTKI